MGAVPCFSKGLHPDGLTHTFMNTMGYLDFSETYIFNSSECPVIEKAVPTAAG